MAIKIESVRPLRASGERRRLVRRAKLLAWAGNGWHLIEFGIAVGAGIAASSIALIGFGLDSLIESLAGSIILWRERDCSRGPHRTGSTLSKLMERCCSALITAVAGDASAHSAPRRRPSLHAQTATCTRRYTSQRSCGRGIVVAPGAQ
jgi:hypothetical protein